MMGRPAGVPHRWEKSGGCLWCDSWCPNCNDCKCVGKGWELYAMTECPMVDTHAGRDRPPRLAVDGRLSPIDPRHGTIYGYSCGCRCDDCKAQKVIRNRDYLKGRKVRDLAAKAAATRH